MTLATIITYSCILRLLTKGQVSRLSVDNASKVVSVLHSLAVSTLALYLLRSDDWSLPTPEETLSMKSDTSNTDNNSGDLEIPLDDSQNVIINGRSSKAKALLAWEAGYLFYDTVVLILDRRTKEQETTFIKSLTSAIKSSPDVFIHHVLLFLGLASLPTYFSVRRELGTWVFTSFLLMNASTPFLHLRTFYRRQYGKKSMSLEFLFVVAFAASRFGLVFWVLQQYAKYHDLDTWSAFQKLYFVCRAGTMSLVGFNAIWWFTLVSRLTKQLIIQKR